MRYAAAIALVVLIGAPAYGLDFVRGGSSSAASATAVPATPQPTPTLVATATPQPTPTLVPTATPQPTPTVVPTATPIPIPFMAGSTNNFATGTTYLAASGVSPFDSLGNNLIGVARAGTAKNLACWTSASAQTSTKSVTITINKNGVTDGPSCVLNSTSTCNTLLSTAFQSTGKCCEDTSGTLAFAAGDGVYLKFVGANTPNVGIATCQWLFQ